MKPLAGGEKMLLSDSPLWEQHQLVSELIDSLMAWQLLDHRCHYLDCQEGLITFTNVLSLGL